MKKSKQDSQDILELKAVILSIKAKKKKLQESMTVLKAKKKFGKENKNEVLQYLKAKYGDPKGTALVAEYWDQFNKPATVPKS